MSYFRELPDVQYQSNLSHKISSQEYVRIKNLFRRVKILDSIQDQVTLFNRYVILEGQRPDNVAEAVYGSSDRDWIVILTANITNIRDQWPLSNNDLYRYAENKYGTALNDIHHYETLEVIDSKGRLILPEGQRVDQNFTIPAPYDFTLNGNSYIAVGAYDNTQYSGSGTINPVIGVSNFDYETIKNEEKREIFLLKSEYIQQYLNDFRNIMNYKESSQYVDRKLIRTENTRLIS
jgi:hypothetical protein